jgi:gamma-glutamyltranspeptidase
VFTEARISQQTLAALGEAGFDLRPNPQNYAAAFGRNQLIVVAADGTFRGASDPRRDGGVAAYSRR